MVTFGDATFMGLTTLEGLGRACAYRGGIQFYEDA